MKIGIIITAKDLVEMTKAAVGSIRTKHDYVLILIDDLSTDGTQEWMNTVPNAIVIRKFIPSLAGKWNIGVVTAWGQDCDTVLICNNDILFHPATIDALVTRMEQGDVAMVSALNLRDDSRLNVSTDIFGIEVTDAPTEAPNPDFSCFMINKATWDKVGVFDTNFTPCYFEDNDYHYRMQQEGLLAIVTTGAPYLHYGSQTQNSVPGGLCPSYKFECNREYFVAKHGVDPTTYKPV